MYLLLVVLGIITFIHSILLIFVIRKNKEIMHKIEQFSRRKNSSKIAGKQVDSKVK
ncbi:hypothetical protein ACWOCC_13805 [Enterococcus ureasiticus]